ncbi:MAG: YdiU family protein [Paracoccaceae bacterium]|nr:MAG: YdiU family protein [Paracoccaceae bacterium]
MTLHSPSVPPFGFSHSYAEALPGGYVEIAPDPAPMPRLVWWNAGLAEALGLPHGAEAAGGLVISGAALPPDARPIAQAYAGHQFGGFSPQLGDGRAHLLGEVTPPGGGRFDIALKGSGRTPFSRGGDGRAVLGPMLREALVSEAMAALGIPTTRTLGVATTGRGVWREAEMPGAAMARVAASHIRVGTFQFFAARGDRDRLARLLAHAVARHDPDLAAGDALGFLDRVAGRQAALIARWMGVGFIHGVMNTDNMAVSGETIDYGPCAFLEGYDPGAVYSSIDHQGRYAYGNQPGILVWNLARLAEALLPLIDADADRAVDRAMAVLEGVAARYRAAWEAVMRRKLGLTGEEPDDGALADGFLQALAARGAGGQGADFTLAFRRLAEAAEGDAAPLRLRLADPAALDGWLPRWRDRLARSAPDAAARLRAANPVHVPRNHLVEEALAAATAGDMAPFHALMAAVTDPFTESPGRTRLALPAPEGFDGAYRTFCGT